VVQLQRHAGPDRWLAAAAGFLTADPVSTNVQAVTAGRIAAGEESTRPHQLWATIEDRAGQVVGVAIHTPPRPLALSRMPHQAAASLADALAGAGHSLSGVIGPRPAAEAFAQTWAARTGTRAVPRRASSLLRLGRLRPPETVPGAAMVAREDQVDLVAHWLRWFSQEADPGPAVEDSATIARRRVLAGQVWLWVDGGLPVSLAAASAPAFGVVRLGPVFTPPAARRRGYASAVTAALSAASLGAGAAEVVLVVDQDNQRAARVYRAIGFRLDHHWVELELG